MATIGILHERDFRASDLLRQQLQHQLSWLEQLRATVSTRSEHGFTHDEIRLGAHGPTRPPAVLAAGASPMAISVVGSVARATGVLPIVIEGEPGEGGSLLRAAERSLPSSAVAVVVIEASNPGSLIALGYCAGALGPEEAAANVVLDIPSVPTFASCAIGPGGIGVGPEDVIAVCAPGLPPIADLGDFATVTIGPGDGWRHALGALLEAAGFAPTKVAATRS